MFRRRDLRRPENGVKVLDRVAQELSNVGKVESRPGKIENRDLTMVLVPLAGVGHAVKPQKPEKKSAPLPAEPDAREPQDEETATAKPETTGERAAAASPEAVSSR
jgi:translation initiation factor IF-3